MASVSLFNKFIRLPQTGRDIAIKVIAQKTERLEEVIVEQLDKGEDGDGVLLGEYGNATPRWNKTRTRPVSAGQDIILEDSGALKNSIRAKMAGVRIDITANVPYAALALNDIHGKRTGESSFGNFENANQQRWVEGDVLKLNEENRKVLLDEIAAEIVQRIGNSLSS